jgi:hypothetical protein
MVWHCSHPIGCQISKTARLFIWFPTHSYIVWVNHKEISWNFLGSWPFGWPDCLFQGELGDHYCHRLTGVTGTVTCLDRGVAPPPCHLFMLVVDVRSGSSASSADNMHGLDSDPTWTIPENAVSKWKFWANIKLGKDRELGRANFGISSWRHNLLGWVSHTFKSNISARRAVSGQQIFVTSCWYNDTSADTEGLSGYGPGKLPWRTL